MYLNISLVYPNICLVYPNIFLLYKIISLLYKNIFPGTRDVIQLAFDRKQRRGLDVL